MALQVEEGALHPCTNGYFANFFVFLMTNEAKKKQEDRLRNYYFCDSNPAGRSYTDKCV